MSLQDVSFVGFVDVARLVTDVRSRYGLSSPAASRFLLFSLMSSIPKSSNLSSITNRSFDFPVIRPTRAEVQYSTIVSILTLDG